MPVEDQIMMQDYKEALLEILYVRSFIFDEKEGFLLSSGQRSNVYIDAKKTTLSAEGMENIGYAFFNEIKNEPIDAIGGLTMGADPIAYATALVATMNGKALDAFVVRKEPKKHGTMKWIEGNLRPGSWVCVVEDVVTTGASVVTAIERLRESGFHVRRVIALVDREEGGRENIEKADCKFVSLLTKTDFIEFHKKHGQK